MQGLDISKVPFDLIINILNILIMFVIVRFLVYKPVRKFLDARDAKIKAQTEEADKKLQEALALQAKYRELTEQAEKQAEVLLKNARDEADRQAQDTLDAAKKKAEKLIADAQERVAVKEEESMLEIQDKVIDLSLAISAKIMGEKMDDAANRRLAKRFFDEELHLL